MNNKTLYERFKNRITFFSIILLGLCISIFIFLLINYFINFFKTKYSRNLNALSNSSDLFDSIVSVFNIVITAYLSYLIYNFTKKANCDSHNLNVASSSYIILKTFERWVVNMHIKFLNPSLNTFSIIDENELSSQASKLIGFIQNDKIRDGLYSLCIFICYSKSKESIDSILDYNLLIKKENLNTMNSIKDILDKFDEDRSIHQYNYVKDEKIRAALNELYRLSRSK